MQNSVKRESIDLSALPDLVVVMLGFRVRRWRGVLSILRIGRGLSAIRQNKPDGLLHDEQCFYSLTHVGIRQYWRDYESLERFTRSEPHATWWRDFLRDSGGAGFWHEAYRMSGGMEGVYVDMPAPIGFGHFAPSRDPRGPFLSARARIEAGRVAA
ncbi:DUF4188 domain-containing protein [Sphingomonas populi]|uniref:DUF4188 domain-containing protein n=1 Tax=Sphingomonas populi TaxID=2484750 RepID=A0A4Q6XZG9_9SPHN|nr:DUF4188 domain-containing protein [Sphingomonas populi]RZF65675.1 DUF4188 domain-containing protein [Sphingomonas populi]